MCFRVALHSLRIALVLFIGVALLPVPCVSMLLLCVSSRAKEWRGIVPLHSTRTDVERLLGPPKTDRSDTIFYETEAEQISIEFSKGPCNVEFSSWNVSAGTVISIWVTPTLPQLNFKNLLLDQKGYIKTRDSHRPEIVYYRNEAEGIEYSVHEESGVVGLVKYLPAAADESLKCPEPRNRLSETIEVAQYSNIPLASERRILDTFAQQIIRYTSVNYASPQAYILVYKDERRRTRNSTSVAKRAKEYLINRHHIDPDRISILEAGERKALTIKLYLVPPGASPPHLGSLL